jgi:peptide/nickel transport system substrate-binding protein
MQQGLPSSGRNYGILTDHLKEPFINIIDDYSFEYTLKKPNPNFVNFFLPNHGWAALSPFPKKRAEELGEDGMVSNLEIGTGPYRLLSYEGDDEIRVEALTSHWRKVPEYAKVTVLQIPESTTQVAALEAGEVDIISAPIPLLDKLEDQGFKLVAKNWGGNWNTYVSGQFCMDEWQGEPVPPREAYDPSKPWIGDCDDPESLENARKFRWGLSMAINRKSIADNIFKGFAFPLYIPEFPKPYQDYFSHRADEWVVPYDPEMAKQYLADAGYPDGVEVPYNFNPDNVVEPGEAVLQALIRDLDAVGVTLKVETEAWPSFFDKIKARTYSGLWMAGGWHMARTPEDVRLGRRPSAQVNTGLELKGNMDLVDNIFASTTFEEQMNGREELYDYFFQNQWVLAMVWHPVYIAMNPDTVGEWDLSFASHGSPDRFEYIKKPK